MDYQKNVIVEPDNRGSMRFKCNTCIGFMDIIGVTTVDGPRESEIICTCKPCQRTVYYRFRWVGK